ncbi:fatty-acid amide hydrolase 1-like isoform X1 [Alligator mississippiensis]|uniref:fatty-acid amide hydrolase 1-like isoform X1 n=1 Tax=Alligator mississippiensis TaxID=8496 RepID=UPI0028779EE9|nr:fatty-acid amide hydrolase 1-like isoform X1 [Alligator mississippiensis]
MPFPGETWLNPYLGTAVLCCLVVTIWLLRWKRRAVLWKQVEEARRKREQRLERMQKAALTFREQNPGVEADRILSLPLVELSEELRNGSLPPEHVLYTYLDKAFQVNKDINCLTDFLQECESQLQEVKKQEKKGLLYGIPVSVKDSIECKGHDSTMGFLKNLNRPAAEDSVVVQVLKRQGAIPFAKSNVPQGLLSYDCSNVIFGPTANPLNHARSPGGSSGGEGALIGSGGSILGIGTDIGGSLRIPAAFCGICAFKPTGSRLSQKGMVAILRGQKSAIPAIGPMARDVDSLALFMRALLCDDLFRLDSSVPPMPFKEEVYASSRPLRIGYHDTDSLTLATPSMRRAVLETKKLLEDAGHTLVPFKPHFSEDFFFNVCLMGLFADGSSTYVDNFKGELKEPYARQFLLMTKMPDWFKKLISWITGPIIPRLSKMLGNLVTRSVKEVWALHSEIEVTKRLDTGGGVDVVYLDFRKAFDTGYKREFMADWRKLDLDVMLCPMFGPAFKAGYPSKIPVLVSYTVLHNFLDFPAGVVPVTTVTEEDEEALKSYKGYHHDWYDKLLVKATCGAVGLPLAVQCVALPWEEELCLRFMKEVERLTQQKQKHL